jgi:hypothetical protein
LAKKSFARLSDYSTDFLGFFSKKNPWFNRAFSDELEKQHFGQSVKSYFEGIRKESVGMVRKQIQSIDQELAHLRLPMDTAELCSALEALTANCDAYDFVADRGARKARECWIASRFLAAHSKQTGRRYEVTSLITEAPDIEYRDVARSRTVLSIEAAELLSPGRKRHEEYLQKKQHRKAREQSGQPDELSFQDIPGETIDSERRAFSGVASNALEEKLRRDYGPNCTLVLYVNLWLFGDEPIREFVTTYTMPEAVRFREIWFLYNEEIIPLPSAVVPNN